MNSEINNEEIQKVLASLKTKISELNYNNWIKPTKFSVLEDNKINIEVPNKFIQDWISDNYLNLIKYEFFKILGVEQDISFKISSELNESIALEIEKKDEVDVAAQKVAEQKKERPSNEDLNEKYTFSSFVVGNSNQFAFAACKAVANLPAKAYNPLFIYGGVGLGKTHLLQAIGLEIQKSQPGTKVLYLHSEQFTNELINSIRYDKMFDFRKKFREACDVLLIDDIQFIGGKERTQEEFFHTFNFLYESRKQVVLTSDKLPKDIPQLEERLLSRFGWGLIADIQLPDIETRVAILRKKAESEKITLPDEVAMYLASNVRSNVRELEGCLTRISAFASLTNTEITLELSKEVLKNTLASHSRVLTVEEVQKRVADHFNIKISDLKSSRRLKSFAVPRQIAMFLCRKHVKSSYPELGQKFGGKDHSTVVHAVQKIEKLSKKDMGLQGDILSIEKDFV